MSTELQTDDDHEAYLHSLGFGDYLPEEAEPLALSTMTRLGNISRLAAAIPASDPEQQARWLRVSHSSMDIAIVLSRKIRPSYLIEEDNRMRKIAEQVDKTWQTHESQSRNFFAKKRRAADKALDKALDRESRLERALKMMLYDYAAREYLGWELDEMAYEQEQGMLLLENPEEKPKTETEPMQETPTNQWNLSDGELEVFRLLPLGLSNTEIADRLMRSAGTIKSRVGEILDKTGQKNRTLATTLAYETYTDEEKETLLVKIDTSRFRSLTPTERSLLPLLAKGLKNEEIAAQRQLSVGHTGTQVSSINKKLGMKRIQLGIFEAELQRARPIQTEEEPASAAEQPKIPPQPKPNAPRTKRSIEKPLPPDALVKSLAINAARKVVRIIHNSQEGNLKKFGDLRFSIKVDNELLETLHRTGFISAEEMEESRLGYLGTAAAMVLHGAKDGRKLLGSKENRAHFSQMVNKEIHNEIDRAQKSRLYKTQDPKKR